MKANQQYSDTFFVMADKDDDLVLIDWLQGGQVRKAEFPAEITAWTFNEATKHIVLTNMKSIVAMNVGKGLRILEMHTTFGFKELVNVVTEQNQQSQAGQSN